MASFSAFKTGLFGCICVLAWSFASAQNRVDPGAIHLVWMGGNDCPPCVYWRGHDLPRLQQSAEFKAIRFSYVTKGIRSPVPAAMFLPAEVKPFKEQLDIASSGRGGSPQAALLVNGVVFDYFHGTRSADEIEAMIVAIRTGGKYPFKPCTQVSREWHKCAVAG